MEKFPFTVQLEVEVEAFDEDDAKSIVKDTLDPGEMGSFIFIKKTIIK